MFAHMDGIGNSFIKLVCASHDACDDSLPTLPKCQFSLSSRVVTFHILYAKTNVPVLPENL